MAYRWRTAPKALLRDWWAHSSTLWCYGTICRALQRFEQVLQRVRATALEAFAHQDIPFDWLVQEFGQRRDTSRAPLVQIMFNVTNAPMHGIVFNGLDLKPMIADRGGAQFELSLAVDPIVTRTLLVEYNTDLFDRPTIERLIGQYFTILEAAAATPATRIAALPLLPAAERSLL